MLRAVDAQVPEEEQQALNFFDRLDAAGHGACKLQYYNRENRPATRITSVEEAYKHAKEFIRPAPTRRFDVYNATTGRGGRGEQTSGGRGHGSDSNTKRWATCRGCGEEGHFIRDFPNVEEDSDEECGHKDGSTWRHGVCYGCGVAGYYICDCPNIKEAAEEEKKKEDCKATESKKKSVKTIAITRPFIIS